MLAQEDGSASTAIATVAFGSGTVAVGSGSKQGKQSEPKLNQCDLLLKTLLSEKACEASLKRSYTAAGKERDVAFAELRKAQYKHMSLLSKHEKLQEELKQKATMVGLIRDAYTKAKLANVVITKIGEEQVTPTEDDVSKQSTGNDGMGVILTNMESTVKVNGMMDIFEDGDDEELLEAVRATEANLMCKIGGDIGEKTTKLHQLNMKRQGMKRYLQAVTVVTLKK
jgi:hypothetical protein